MPHDTDPDPDTFSPDDAPAYPDDTDEDYPR